MVDVSDRGSTPRFQTCTLTIDLFNLEDTVTARVVVNIEGFDPDTFEQILENILNLNIEITDSTPINSTYYSVDLFANELDSQQLVSPQELALLLTQLARNQPQLLIDAGFSIAEVFSNGATEASTPPTAVPTRPIPTWAVVVIVVLNSVIIIGVLLLILGIVWKRYTR